MKAQSHTLRENGRSGWDVILLDTLRSVPLTEEAARVELILSLMVEIQTHFEDWKKDVPIDTRSNFLQAFARNQESKRMYLQGTQRLEAALQRYQWRSTITPHERGFREDLGWSENQVSKEVYWEYAIVRYLLNQTKIDGEIERFRRCANCRHWFYAKTSHQRFCGETCRRRHTAESPSFKEKRRAYMKQVYRPQQKERDSRSLSLAKSVARKGKG